MLLGENRQALELFLACQSQWRAGFAGVVGLDYCGVEKAAAWLEIPMTRDVFRKIQVLERAVLLKQRKEYEQCNCNPNTAKRGK